MVVQINPPRKKENGRKWKHRRDEKAKQQGRYVYNMIDVPSGANASGTVCPGGMYTNSK
jgi:hypothetical protein